MTTPMATTRRMALRVGRSGHVRWLENEQDVPGREPLDVLDRPAREERLDLVAQLRDVEGADADRVSRGLAQASSSLTE